MQKIEKILIALVVIIVLIGVAYFLFSFQKTKIVQPQAIKIGVMVPLSGESSSYGFPIQKGILLAKKNFNEDNIEIVTEDSGCDKDKAITAVNKLVADGVVAIIGEVCSGASMAALPIAEAHKIIMVSPASTNPGLSGKSNFFFRTVPSDALQGVFAADLLAKDGFKKIGIIYSNEPYGVGFEKVLKENIVRNGGIVASSVAVESNKIDLKSEVGTIKKSNPDAIYLVSNSPTASIAAIREIRSQGIKVKIFGSEAVKSQTILDEVGNLSDGIIVSSLNSGSKSFIDAYKIEYGSEATTFVAQAYDAFTAIYLATQTGATTGEGIKSAIRDVSFDGVTGHIQFDTNGDPKGSYDLFVAKDGSFIPLEQ